MGLPRASTADVEVPSVDMLTVVLTPDVGTLACGFAGDGFGLGAGLRRGLLTQSKTCLFLELSSTSLAAFCEEQGWSIVR